MKRILLLLAIIAITALHSNAQVETRYYLGGDIKGELSGLLRYSSNTKTIKMPVFDLEKMQKEDAELEGIEVTRGRFLRPFSSKRHSRAL